MRLSLAATISHGRVYRRLGLGPESRIHLLRNLLTGLVRHERIEATWARVDEMRGYAEKVRAKPFSARSSLRPPRWPCVGSRATLGDLSTVANSVWHSAEHVTPALQMEGWLGPAEEGAP